MNAHEYFAAGAVRLLLLSTPPEEPVAESLSQHIQRIDERSADRATRYLEQKGFLIRLQTPKVTFEIERGVLSVVNRQ